MKGVVNGVLEYMYPDSIRCNFPSNFNPMEHSCIYLSRHNYALFGFRVENTIIMMLP